MVLKVFVMLKLLVNGLLESTHLKMESETTYMWEKTSLKHVVPDCHGKQIKVRSKLEIDVANTLTETKIPWQYEVTKIPYTIPESLHHYTVDFTVGTLLLEGKGILIDAKERQKYILIKQQHPELDIRFIFDNPLKLCNGTKQTHAFWAEKNGFPYCSRKDKVTIQSWVMEKNKCAI